MWRRGGERERTCGEVGRGCTWMRWHPAATIQSRNEPLSTHSQATGEGVRARPSMACHYLPWNCGGHRAVLLSTPGLCHGMEGCGRGISHGSCMGSTKPTPRHPGSAERPTCQERRGGQPMVPLHGHHQQRKGGGVIHSILGRLLLRSPLWRGLCVPTDPTGSSLVRISVLDIPLEEPLSSPGSSLLVTLDPGVEISPLGKSPPLFISPSSRQDSYNRPRVIKCLRQMREVSERQGAGAVGESMAEQLPPLASSSR